MIRLPDVALPQTTADKLKAYQGEVDSVATYAEQVAAAKALFGSRNKKENSVFKVVREKLTELCGDAGRCCYCEVSQPDEVEHVWPKDLYPERVFVWENYTYSCGTCNGPKKNQFAVFVGTARKWTEVGRGPSDPVEPPVSGKPVLIDPRIENPLDFMELDLMGTFRFEPIAAEGTRDYARADYTIRVLRLNERELLKRARRSAFNAYRAMLKEYRDARDGGASQLELSRLQSNFRTHPHPAVWQEMQRQQADIPELRKLFRDVPEALKW